MNGPGSQPPSEAADASVRGTVVTFYSYKGGTGRTMALANTACTLSWTLPPEQNVLVVDWDLEAPGLHRFFPHRLRRGREPVQGLGLGTEPGLIDLLIDLAAALPQREPADEAEAEADAVAALGALNLARYIDRTEYPQVWLLRAGRDDDGEYSRRVNTFSWEHLFQRAPMIYRLLAEALAAHFRWVLVDSRTGVTDISGICTSLLPDKLVVVFTPNRQSLSGVRELVSRALTYRRDSDDLRGLTVYPLPSRIEASLDEQRRDWRMGNLEAGIVGFQPVFEELFRECYGLAECHLGSYFDVVQIQQTPDCAYGEVISVRQEGGDRFSLANSYREFVRRLLTGGPPWHEGAPAVAGLPVPSLPPVPGAPNGETTPRSAGEGPELGVARPPQVVPHSAPSGFGKAEVPIPDHLALDRAPAEAASAAVPPEPARRGAAQSMAGAALRIFLSYASEDRGRVEAVARRLAQQGYDVFWDRERLATGRDFSQQLESELDQADAVLVFWSRRSVASEWVRVEAAEAERRGVLLPVLLDDAAPPLLFRHLQSFSLERMRPADLDELTRLAGEVAARRPGEAGGDLRNVRASPPTGRTSWGMRALGGAVVLLVGLLAWVMLAKDTAAPAQTQAAAASAAIATPPSVPLPAPVQRTVAIPEVIGLPAEQALAVLDASGLMTRMVTAGSQDEKALIQGVVIQQSLAAGTVVVDGTRMRLTVETRTVSMPDVVGRRPAEATKILGASGLKVAGAPELVVQGDRPGHVHAQVPPPRTLMAVGAVVRLQVTAAGLPGKSAERQPAAAAAEATKK